MQRSEIYEVAVPIHTPDRARGEHVITGQACTPWALPDMTHLELADVQALTDPAPARGQLGPWRPTRDLLAQVLCQLPHLRP
ncbi:hypothetical protein ACFCZ6_14210 [Streptomyces hydrogenans]|uniref:hypothetical protein n=1 Tax=Streptomyces hydrogenans TaxID=1873719 RepID=UPI0035E01DF8